MEDYEIKKIMLSITDIFENNEVSPKDAFIILVNLAKIINETIKKCGG